MGCEYFLPFMKASFGILQLMGDSSTLPVRFFGVRIFFPVFFAQNAISLHTNFQASFKSFLKDQNTIEYLCNEARGARRANWAKHFEMTKWQKNVLRRFARSALWAFLTQPRRSWLTCIFCTWSEHLTLYRISHQIHKADFPPFLRDGIFGKKLCSSSSKRLRNGSSAFLLTWLE